MKQSLSFFMPKCCKWEKLSLNPLNNRGDQWEMKIRLAEKSWERNQMLIPIESVKPLITELRKNGFYVSGTIERMVLEQAGE